MLRAVGDLGGDDLDARSAALIVAADKLGSEPMIQKTQELNELLMRELRWHESFLKSIDREEAYLAWCRMRGTS